MPEHCVADYDRGEGKAIESLEENDSVGRLLGSDGLVDSMNKSAS